LATNTQIERNRIAFMILTLVGELEALVSILKNSQDIDLSVSIESLKKMRRDLELLKEAL